MTAMANDIRRYIAAVFAAAAIVTPLAAPSRAEGQSARPRVDFNESAERARTLRERGRGGSWSERRPSEPFQLFNDCEPVTLHRPTIALFTDADFETDSAAIEKTAAQIQRAAETRFWNAGLLDAMGRQRGWFGILIAGAPHDFIGRASFAKVVIDLATGDIAFIDTWDFMGPGGHSTISPTPEVWASSTIDLFLTEYLAANADACAERGTR